MSYLRHLTGVSQLLYIMMHNYTSLMQATKESKFSKTLFKLDTGSDPAIPLIKDTQQRIVFSSFL